MATTATPRAANTHAGTATQANVNGSPVRHKPSALLVRACFVVAGATGATVLAALAIDLIPTATAGHGVPGLLAGVQALLAGSAAVLCAYLALVHLLALIVLAAGRRSRTGRTAGAVLRVLAPRVATKLGVGVIAASSVLPWGVVGTAIAADHAEDSYSTAAVMLDGERASPDSVIGAPDPIPAPASPVSGAAPAPSAPARPVTTVLGGSATERTHVDGAATGTAAHSLGWSAAPAAPEHSVDTDTTTPPPAELGWSPSSEPTTVTVRPGDSLWSITDDLLGPGADPIEDIARHWPALYERNADVIGSDPDSISPGLVLTVPDALTTYPSPLTDKEKP